MMPEFIVVELDLNEYIVAQRISDISYRKFATAVGRPSAEKMQEALVRRDQPEVDPAFDPTSRRVRDLPAAPGFREQLDAAARIRIEKDDEGTIEGARGMDIEDRGP